MQQRKGFRNCALRQLPHRHKMFLLQLGFASPKLLRCFFHIPGIQRFHRTYRLRPYGFQEAVHLGIVGYGHQRHFHHGRKDQRVQPHADQQPEAADDAEEFLGGIIPLEQGNPVPDFGKITLQQLTVCQIFGNLSSLSLPSAAASCFRQR